MRRSNRVIGVLQVEEDSTPDEALLSAFTSPQELRRDTATLVAIQGFDPDNRLGVSIVDPSITFNGQPVRIISHQPGQPQDVMDMPELLVGMETLEPRPKLRKRINLRYLMACAGGD